MQEGKRKNRVSVNMAIKLIFEFRERYKYLLLGGFNAKSLCDV